MITSKYINSIIIGVLIIAIIFTGMFTFFPDSIGIGTQSSQMEYESKLFNKDGIISIDIKANESDWANMLENATKEEYISCDVTINGETFKSVGIRPKGNSSLSMVAGSDSDRYSFKFEFDHYIDGQTCYGLDKLVINNIQSDATYMKEYLSYDLMSYIGVTTPLYSYTNVTVNGEDWGFYIAVEALEESFAQRNYGNDYGMLYKPESMGMRGNGVMKDFMNNNPPEMPNSNAPQTPAKEENATQIPAKQNNETQTPAKAGNATGEGMKNGFGGGPGGNSGGGTDLIYTDDSVSSYSNIFDNEVFKGTESDYQRVIEAIKNLNSGTDLEKYINVDETLRYFAANTVLVNLDSYFSSMKHNYYLYEDDGQLTMLPWDYNLAFGGFQSGTASSAVNFPIDTPVSGVELTERPFFAKLLEVDEYKEKYHEYLQEIVDGYFNNGSYEATITKLNTLISEYVKNDASAFYTYDEYTEAVAMIKEFGMLRAQSIQGQLQGTIPSTSEGQSAESDKLIDASSINLSVMGTQGGGEGGKGVRMVQQPDGQQSNGAQQPTDTQQPAETQQPNGNLQQPADTQQDGIQPPNGNMQPLGNMPDREVLMKAMQIIQAANGGELTDEQMSQLKELGLTDEQITSMKEMSSRFESEGMNRGGGPGAQPSEKQGFGGRGGNPIDRGRGGEGQLGEAALPGSMEKGSTNNQVTSSTFISSNNIIINIVALVCLAVGLLFIIKFKRKRY